MSTAVATLGTTIERETVAIGQIQDISGPDISTDTDEITNHSSPGGVEEFIATIKRVGEITFPLVFNSADASHGSTAGLIKAWEDRSLDEYVMTYPDGSMWEFSAYVTGLSMSAPVDGHLSADVTLRIALEPNFTDAAS
jgi:predicted secreted protein